MRAICVLIVAVCVAGCGEPDDGRLEITGTVKFKGQPIKDGAMVEFASIEAGGSAGSSRTTAGQFTILKANGLKPGNYLVRVTLGDGKTAVNPVDENAPPGPGGGANIISKELVPPDWNRNSKQQVTVTKDGPNKFDFNIP